MAVRPQYDEDETSEDIDSERLAAFFDNAPDAILVVDENGEVQRANARVEDVFGHAPDELEGECVEILVPPAVRDEHPAMRDAYFDDPHPRPMGAGLDLIGERKDGTTFPVEVSLSPIDAGDETEVIAAVRDKTAHQHLRRKYRAVLETAPDSVVIIGREDRVIREVNDAATDLFGVPESRLVGREMTVLHPGDDPQRYCELFDDHPRNEKKVVARFDSGDHVAVETGDGERVPVEISAQHTALQGESVVVAMFRDVSEREAYERDLRHQIDRLERLSELLSHDLRNPLNVAEGSLEIARDAEDRSRLREVERAHDRVREIIEDALTMVRGGTEVEAVDPLELSGVAATCWSNVSTAEASLRVASNGLVYADEGRFGHLFENLFRNAVDHGGVDVTVTVGVTEDGFFVADDGPGIPPEHRESVLESGWTTSSSGSGLGLSIVADIAAAHGWAVTVSESRDGGAQFDFTDVRTAPYEDSYTPVHED